MWFPVGLFVLIGALAVSSSYLVGLDVLEWSCIQVFRSVAGRSLLTKQLSFREETIWSNWERMHVVSKNKQEGFDQAPSTLLDIPTLTSTTQLDEVDLSRPFLARNMSASDVLSIQDLMSPPLSDLEIDYFVDARRRNTVPDSHGLVGDIMGRMLQGGPEKIGTQMILEAFPQVMEQFIDNNDWLRRVFGESRVDGWRAMGMSVTSPVFASRGRAVDPVKNKKSLDETTRTDLHCEPISNVVGHTEGEKLWTLVEPKYSFLLRPTVAPDGRAYFYSSLDPFDPNALQHVPRYEVLARKGDVLYLPSWTWHRIQYLPNITAVSMSIFEFVPIDFVRNNAVFAAALVPNLIKELLGINIQ